MDFESIMGRVSELAQTGVSKISELTLTGVSKAKELAEIAKLKMANSTEEDSIRKAYTDIGKLYYAERGMAPEAPYSALCEKITGAKEKIAYNEEKISDIKAAGDIKDADIENLLTEIPPEETITPAAPVAPVDPVSPVVTDDIPPEDHI